MADVPQQAVLLQIQQSQINMIIPWDTVHVYINDKQPQAMKSALAVW